MTSPGAFCLVPAEAVIEILDGSVAAAADLVRAVYVDAAAGGVVNPPSLFLRPDPGRAERFIALPAALPGGPSPVAGMKWIGSFPGNLDRGLPRASAVIILNDLETGFPMACLEGAVISATRTALSAVVGAEVLAGGRETGRLAVIGAGVISRRTLEMLLANGWRVGEVAVFDSRVEQADGLVGELAAGALGGAVGFGVSGRVARSAAEAVAGADLVLIATTATAPWFDDPALARPGVTVLHLSLRDITARTMAHCDHVVDDPTHAAREGTSLELAIRTGLAAESIRPIGGLLSGAAPPRDPARSVIYSPFGLGSLDVALASFVLEQARARGLTIEVPEFFGRNRAGTRLTAPDGRLDRAGDRRAGFHQER